MEARAGRSSAIAGSEAAPEPPRPEAARDRAGWRVSPRRVPDGLARVADRRAGEQSDTATALAQDLERRHVRASRPASATTSSSRSRPRTRGCPRRPRRWRCACRELDLAEGRAWRWLGRRERDELADRPPGGSPSHGLLADEAAEIAALVHDWGEIDPVASQARPPRLLPRPRVGVPGDGAPRSRRSGASSQAPAAARPVAAPPVSRVG